MLRSRLKQILRPPDPLIYGITPSISLSLISKFIRLNADAATRAFISDSMFHLPSLLYVCSRPILLLFFSPMEINAWFRESKMFVVSSEQIKKLLRIEEGFMFERVLDIGAGDGNVTKEFLPFCRKLVATETSDALCGCLRELKIDVFKTPTITDFAGFDLYICLNVLDRCEEPFVLLKQLFARIRTEGSILMLALVLPFFPIAPLSNQIPVAVPHDQSFESWAEAWESYFVQEKLEIISFSRVPYLSAGNLVRPYYVLDDALFVLKSS